VGRWARVWAAGYDAVSVRFERVQGPHRRRLVGEAAGEVLEVGAGTGLNFPRYERARRVVACEPDEAMRARARRRARRARVPVALVAGDAGRLPFADASFDTVVFSLVLCSVPRPEEALAEARRVLRPGGEARFYEHVRSERPGLARWQDLLARPWRTVNRGCTPNRETVGAVERAGFRVVELERFELPGVPPIVRPHVLGVGRRA
jgi:ubiquinone/menaquinone biosynthesis C-methylase UbiE